MCEAITRILSSTFTFALTIVQGASKVLNMSGSNLVFIFMMSGQFKEKLILPLVKMHK